MGDAPLCRLIGSSLREQLEVASAVVVTGARQTGKSTLVRELVPGPRPYVSFDSRERPEVAWRDLEKLVADGRPVTLDEAQRKPAVLESVNRSIAHGAAPGVFLLTEQASVVRLRRVAEPQTGGVVHLTLRPMTRREQMGLGRAGIWGELLNAHEPAWLELVKGQPQEPEDWKELALRGGLPVPALHLRAHTERAEWFDNYVENYLEHELFFDGYLHTFGRELQDLSARSQSHAFGWLLRTAASELGQRPSEQILSAGPRAADYLELLVNSLTLVPLPAYLSGPAMTQIKQSRLYWADTGLALHLAQTPPTNVHLQNVVLADLTAWRDSRSSQTTLSYWSTTSGHDVDFILGTERDLLPITVTTARQPHEQGVASLTAFRAEHPEAARAGLLLHTGTSVKWLASDVLAVPWWLIV